MLGSGQLALTVSLTFRLNLPRYTLTTYVPVVATPHDSEHRNRERGGMDLESTPSVNSNLPHPSGPSLVADKCTFWSEL